MCSGYGCSLSPNIFLSEHFCVPGHFQATSVLLSEHFWGPKGGWCSSGEAAAGEEQWHCKMHFKESLLMPQQKLFWVVLYFSAKHTQHLETTDAQLMCLRVYSVYSRTQLSTAKTPVASHFFVFILLKIGNCCRSALPDALVQLKKRALYVVVKLAHLYWNKEKQLKVKRNVREGQKYVKVYFLEHQHSLEINAGKFWHLRSAEQKKRSVFVVPCRRIIERIDGRHGPRTKFEEINSMFSYALVGGLLFKYCTHIKSNPHRLLRLKYSMLPWQKGRVVLFGVGNK